MANKNIKLNFWNDDEIIRAIDKDALEKRILQDRRSQSEIARAAGVTYQTLHNVLIRGTATKRVINSIRLAVNPRMNFSTISPEDIQPDYVKKSEELYKEWQKRCEELRKKREDNHLSNVSDEQHFDYEKEVKFYKDLSDDFVKLCDKYSTIEVLSLASQIQLDILMYLGDCGFDLLQTHEESIANIPSFEERKTS